MKRLQAPAVVKKWKKFLVCGCSHGSLADPKALDAIVKFRKDFKPDTVVHLGDVFDSTAFRTGAKGNKDEAADIDFDVFSGLDFLERLQPHVVFIGNHEDRIWKLQDSPKAIEQKVARDLVRHITKFIRKDLRARFIDHYVITESWAWLGPFKLGHGWMFNESAIRDHADMAGSCMIAHLHRAGVERGRILGGATGICVGMLADPNKLSYADRQRAKTKWTQGWVYGEYAGDMLVHHHRVLNESKPNKFIKL